MSIEEFLDNLTLEEIEELKRLKLAKQNSYNFSKITFEELENICSIKEKYELDIFNEWFDSDIKLNDNDFSFLKKLIEFQAKYIKDYNEEDLKAKFIIPILNNINFMLVEYDIRDFYDEKLTYSTDKFILSGRCDFFISRGLKKSKNPYFFIQEFKKSKEPKDPEPQLLAELISGVEINNFKMIKGAYIVGAIWNFVILQKIGENIYEYYVSENFDSTKIEDLKGIYKNLLFVKEEIKSFITKK